MIGVAGQTIVGRDTNYEMPVKKKKEKKGKTLVATQISVVESQLTLMNDLTKHRDQRRRKRGVKAICSLYRFRRFYSFSYLAFCVIL